MRATIHAAPAVGDPRWLILLGCFFARPLIRAGIWLKVSGLRFETGSPRHSLARLITALGLIWVNMAAVAVGAGLRWLGCAAHRMQQPVPSSRWRRATRCTVADFAAAGLLVAKTPFK